MLRTGEAEMQAFVPQPAPHRCAMRVVCTFGPRCGVEFRICASMAKHLDLDEGWGRSLLQTGNGIAWATVAILHGSFRHAPPQATTDPQQARPGRPYPGAPRQKASRTVRRGADQHRRADWQLDCGYQQGGGAAKGNHAAQAGRCASCRGDYVCDRRRAGDAEVTATSPNSSGAIRGQRWIKQYIRTTP